MGTYKQKRSRKLLDIKTLRLRMQDALQSIEPVFLGEKGKDYDPDVAQLRFKAIHALAAGLGAYQRLQDEQEFLERFKELERTGNHNTNPNGHVLSKVK